MTKTVDQEIVIELSKWKLGLVVAGALAFVLVGVWMLGLESKAVEGSQFDDPESVGVIAWAAIAFFGLCTVVGMKKLMSNRPGLVLTSRGFMDNSSGVSPGMVPWSEVTGIKEYQLQGHRFVSVMLDNPEDYVNRGNTLKRMANRANLKLTGTPVNIASTSLKITYEDLFELVNKYYELNRLRSEIRGGSPGNPDSSPGE